MSSALKDQYMLTTRSKGTHDRLDFKAIRRLYANSRWSEDLQGQIVASPFDLFSVETLRDMHGLRISEGTPTDVFVFAKGEPPKREQTKVGGLPYWPANRAWPTNADGEPYWFQAQFNFADSRDLFPRLPGDVLLILTEDEESWCYDEWQTMHFFWETVGNQALISAHEFPKVERSCEHVDCYGVIYRTADYPRSSRKANKLEVSQSYNLAVLSATKIGGVPHPVEPDQRPSGRYLCQLASIQPAPRVPFPWVNRKTPYSVFGCRNYHRDSFTFGDMGTLVLFLQKDGSIQVTTHSY